MTRACAVKCERNGWRHRNDMDANNIANVMAWRISLLAAVSSHASVSTGGKG